MRIKIITANNASSIEDTELAVNQWIESNPNIEVLTATLNTIPRVDYYQNSAPAMVCNQWVDYSVTIIYNHPLTY